MDENIKKAVEDEPELLQYYLDHTEEVHSTISKFAVVKKEEVRDVIFILKSIDELEFN